MFGKEKVKPELEMFTIFDSKTQSYRDPMLALNDQDMIRQVSNLFQDPQQTQNLLVLNAEDYSLFRIGYYSRKTGTIETQHPEHIANLHDLRAASRNRALLPT